MKIIGTENLKELLRFSPDPDRQTGDDRITLTVLDVLQIVGEGSISNDDSGSGDARRVKRPARKSAMDPVGYWDLTQGPYWVTYNEMVQIPEGFTLVLQPHSGLLKNGLWHPTLVVRDWAEVSGMLLVISARGARIMENAPLSTGFIIGSQKKG